MTDLEQSRQAQIRAMAALVARRNGAAEMQETAAQLCDRRAKTGNIVTNPTARALAQHIRALPLPEGTPGGAYDAYHMGELAERACWIVRRKNGEAVYQEALKRIEMLMDAEKGTAEGEELDLLVILVQFYERAQG